MKTEKLAEAASKYSHWYNKNEWQISEDSFIAGAKYAAQFTPVWIDVKTEKDTRDAGYFEILSNVPGKEQDGISMTILKLWGEVENFYGDPHKKETGRELLLRLQEEYNISFKPLPQPPTK